MNELLHTIWLSLSCTAGSETFARLLTRFNSPADIYYADDEKIASCISSGSRDYKSLINKDTGKAERILKLCESKNIGIITYFDSGFPAGLRRIKNPPVLLYYRGRLPDFENEFFISIVGTRRLSVYGRSNTFKIARDIARAGATVVSGMAIGIDGVALAGAISAGKGTVGVIGCGIDVCYPKCHKRLAREIVKLGCVMTEYAPGVRPDRFNFPKRNRIISALSEATVVMEGSERSGSVITARHAIEQGRTLYAFPGNVGNSGSEASNLLIKNGAKLLTSADDIIRDFEKSSLGKLNPFNLTGSDSYDMYSVLREFEVSCVAIDDEIFKSHFPKKISVKEKDVGIKSSEGPHLQDKLENEKDLSSLFNKSTVDLYKKIPIDEDISIERLVDENHTMRDVMQGILKLEIAKFVTMLPGDRVKRNL